MASGSISSQEDHPNFIGGKSPDRQAYCDKTEEEDCIIYISTSDLMKLPSLSPSSFSHCRVSRSRPRTREFER